jgi:thiamine monophosphate synthase
MSPSEDDADHIGKRGQVPAEGADAVLDTFMFIPGRSSNADTSDARAAAAAPAYISLSLFYETFYPRFHELTLCSD